VNDDDDIERCTGCGVELAPGLLACPACRRLVHATRLASLAAEAEEAERAGRLTDALTAWRAAHALLPAGSTQHGVVTERIRRLGEAVDRAGAAPPAKGGRGGGAAGVGAAAMAVWKLKFALLSVLGKAKLLAMGLASLPTLLSMFAFLAIYRSYMGYVALGLVASMYVHEMGHVAALRAYGIKATAPMFVPGLGAFVRLHQYPIDAREDARVGLAGPVWGCAAAVAALVPGLLLHQHTVLTVASWGAALNLFNLIPFWQLDGARGFRALDTRQRSIVLGLAAATALLLQQPWGWVVCAVGGFRLRSDLPPEGDSRAFRTMAALLVVLPVIAWVAGRAAAP
jgi:Zn-dependent protease